MTAHKTAAQYKMPPGLLDTPDAYLHVPIRNTFHRCLEGTHNSQLYFFKALPFGFNVSPFIFYKVL